jgi:hypothetical protein
MRDNHAMIASCSASHRQDSITLHRPLSLSKTGTVAFIVRTTFLLYIAHAENEIDSEANY